MDREKSEPSSIISDKKKETEARDQSCLILKKGEKIRKSVLTGGRGEKEDET